MIQVLVVEDDPMVAQINREYIQSLPEYSVCACVSDGAQALNYLRKNNKVDLIVLDVYMPHMDGLQMLQQLRSKHQNVDVIFVTAAKEKKIIQTGLQLGAVDYLIKPFTYDRIRQSLERYLARYHLFHQNENMSQQELDEIISKGVTSRSELPKGINKVTLDQVRAAVDASGNQLDPKQLQKQLQLSLVTLRVYLDFLSECGVLRKDTQKGTVGRPTYIYTKIIDGL